MNPNIVKFAEKWGLPYTKKTTDPWGEFIKATADRRAAKLQAKYFKIRQPYFAEEETKKAELREAKQLLAQYV